MEVDKLYSLDKNIGEESWRRRCGCIRTSEKLKHMLDSFPAPPPPTPDYPKSNSLGSTCISAYCTHVHPSVLGCNDTRNEKSSMEPFEGIEERPIKKVKTAGRVPHSLRIFHIPSYLTSLILIEIVYTFLLGVCVLCSFYVSFRYTYCSDKSWRVVGEIVQLIQLSVTATALALYYLIYCYMQLIYYTLRSALYFHNADGAMKITIAVVTITSLVIAFNILLKMERVFLMLY